MMSSTKNTLDSERNSPGFSHTKLAPYNDDDLDRFQRELNRQKIIDIWKKMREGGNSKDGIVQKDKFKQIFFEDFKNIKIKESLVNDVFERFKKRDYGKDEKNEKRRTDEKRNANQSESEKGEIDLHDLVVSLAILSPLTYDDKLELVFDLTDIDEDGCLSPDDICKMMLAIERNFAKECSFIDPENASSLYNVATKKALRRFNYIFLYEGQEEAETSNGGKGRKDKLLGHFKDFMEKLMNKQNLYNTLLPKNYSLRRVLKNEVKEVKFKITKNEEDHFKKFRAELHTSLWKKPEPESKYKNPNPKKEEGKFPNREPGEIESYGYKTIEDEPKNTENEKENLKNKDPIIQQTINVTEHRKKLKDMREKELPKLEEIMGGKYEKIIKRKENYLPPLGKLSANHEFKHSEVQIPDLSSMIDKRVERLKKEFKHIDNHYKDYLLKKLTSSITGGEREKTPSHSKGHK